MPLRVHVPVLRSAFPLLTVELVPLIPSLGIPHLPWRMPPRAHVGASPFLTVVLVPLICTLDISQTGSLMPPRTHVKASPLLSMKLMPLTPPLACPHLLS